MSKGDICRALALIVPKMSNIEVEKETRHLRQLKNRSSFRVASDEL